MRKTSRLAKNISKHLSPQLLRRNWGDHPMAGHCYVASECFYHLSGGKEAGFKPMHIKHEGVSHWWVQGPKGEVVDITAAQFKTPVDYENGKGKGFLTKNPSKRARRLIDLVNSERNCAVSR